ncbi:MAG TPA: hypothetical protein VIL60_08625 [Rhodanobacter sp.]
MKVLDRLSSVRTAQLQMRQLRHDVTTPAAALLARGRGHPLTTVAAAAGVGFAVGSLGVRPLRVPGIAALLGGGLTDVVARGMHWIVAAAAVVDPAAAAVDPDSETA